MFEVQPPVTVEPVPVEVVVLAPVESEGTVPRYCLEIASKSVFEPMLACRSLKVASCVTNVVPSTGWVGS